MQQIILKNFPFIIEKPKVKHLKNIDRLAEQLSIIKTDQAFKGYAMPYKLKIIEKKDPIVQLEASKLHINDLFNEDSMDFLLLIDDDKSHYVYIKDFNTFMFYKTKNKNKKWFCKSCLPFFSSENVLIKHKENCLSINGKQFVKLEKGIMSLKIILSKYQFLLKFMLILSVI